MSYKKGLAISTLPYLYSLVCMSILTATTLIGGVWPGDEASLEYHVL